MTNTETRSPLQDLINALPNRGATEEGVANPFEREYVGWGPYEDYLCEGSKPAGWRSRIVRETWAEFAAEMMGMDDDLNVVIDFYFAVSHEAKNCEPCDGAGSNPPTKQIADDFYDFANTGRQWNDQITDDEVAALLAKGRLMDFTQGRPDYVPSADEVNAWQRGRTMGHDAINRWILVEARARRLGVYGLCPECNGTGSIRLSDDRLELNLWLAHPRKGATRGVHVKSVQPDDLPQVREYLARSLAKMNEHFRWVSHATGPA